MATNLNYNVNVNTTNGVQALNNLQNKVQGLNNAFGGLKNAIAGIAVGQIITNLLRFADGIQDLSDATGIATQSILGFQKAVQAFGGNAEAADKAILKLVQNVGEAAEGSASLQSAFGKVGVSLQDLATLSEQDILAKTIQGLERISDPATRSALAAQLLGKEFRNVNMSGFNEYLAKSTEEAAKSAEAIRSSAELQGNLERATLKVKTALLEVIAPFADFINALDQDKLASAIEAFTKLASVLTALYGVGRLIAVIEGLTVAIGGAAGAALTFGISVAKSFILPIRIAAGLFAIFETLKIAAPDTAKKIGDAFSSAVGAVKEFFGIKPDDTSAALDKNTAAANRNAEATKNAGREVKPAKDQFDELRKSLESVSSEYARMNALNIQQINLQTSLIGKSREESEVSKAKAELLRKEAEEIEKLQDKRSKLTKEQVDAGLGKVIDEQIAKIKEQTKADMEATESAIRNSQERIRAYDLEKFARQSQIDVEKQIRDIQFEMATVTMSEMEKKAAAIRRDAWERAEAEIKAQEAARGTLMTEAEKQKYYDAAKKKTEELIRVNEELYNRSRQFSTGWKRAFQDYVDNATNAAKRAESIFRKATQGMEDLIVNFVKTGKFEWKNFVAMMLEELLRAQIQQIFASLLGGMQNQMSGGGGLMGALGGLFGGGGEDQGGGGILDTILGGISSIFGGGGGTGSGKSMNDPIYVYDVSGGGGFGGGGILGPSQEGGGIMGTIGKAWEGVKSAAGSVWEGIKSVGSSVISGIGSAVGGVWDGIKSVGSSVISGIGNVVGGISDTIGGIFSGGGGGGGGFFDSIGSSIGDIASGIGDFFGGWFANGGTLGAGKWGIAGENGPEIISGPASITPMGGANVTYNINAVDAMSFKQLLAQDPSYIYALSLQGGKGVPARR